MSLNDSQAALMAALAGRGPVPPGFDADRIRASADMLARKRAHALAQAWPCLALMLGSDFQAHFAAYARETTLVAQGGSLADGRLFVQWLETAGLPLTDEVRLKAFGVDLRFARKAQGWVPRRWPGARAVWLPAARCWVIGIWVPGRVGERRLRIGVPGRRP